MKMYILTSIKAKDNCPHITQEYIITHEEFLKLKQRTDLNYNFDKKLKRTNFFSSDIEKIYSVIETKIITCSELK